ncbi:MAG: hypothetical protein CVV44_03950 [Spirochaetae bacterium HGW-Spirochaetae-1]|jgi:hypothetical protein|nr:MAG: hypothetical protein CVV44_03950 [Spirochaetae bacterium HGW-Spirochaetae-1]
MRKYISEREEETRRRKMIKRIDYQFLCVPPDDIDDDGRFVYDFGQRTTAELVQIIMFYDTQLRLKDRRVKSLEARLRSDSGDVIAREERREQTGEMTEATGPGGIPLEKAGFGT